MGHVSRSIGNIKNPCKEVFGMSNRVTVTIGSQSYTLVAKEDPAYIQQIASQVNQELAEVMGAGHLSMADAATLTALNIADKYFKEREAADNLRRQLKEYLDDASRLKMELSDGNICGSNGTVSGRSYTIDDLEMMLDVEIVIDQTNMVANMNKK
jgi:cell division protein ZapA